MPFRMILAALAVSLAASLGAKETRTEHTYRLADGETAARHDFADMALLVGTWQGTAFGNTFEASWAPPSAGSMLGTFKLMDGDTVVFYELLVIKPDADGRFGMRVKHFTDEFVAWEEKPDFTQFRFVAAEPEALHFSGISFYRRGADAMDAYIVMRRGEEVREEKLVYQRVAH